MPDPQRERIRILHQQLLERQQFIRALLDSKSWKMTRPFRWFHSKISRLFSSQNTFNWADEANKLLPTSETQSTTDLTHNDAKGWARKLARSKLECFLSSRINLNFRSSANPKISVLIVAYNNAELTLACVVSLIESAPESLEIIIVDNGSYDETEDLLNQVKNVRILRNNENTHFISAANQAASQARGEFILFLNNDTQVLPGSIESALNTIESAPDIGAVGAKLILPDGSLQEAGSIIWRDGSCLAFGRGENPFSSQYMFLRNVDFCSAAFLLTKRELFLGQGGFDEMYKPAYYEDADYCLKLWQKGMRVIYDPNVAVIHHEFGSSSSTKEPIELQIANRQIFVKRHADELLKQPDSKHTSIMEARTHLHTRKNILFIDDRAPHSYTGSGFPRAHSILLSLLRLDCFVTCYPMFFINEDWRNIYSDIPKEVEVILGSGREGLERFLELRKNYYDAVLCSRQPNMEILQKIHQKREDLFHGSKLVYDSEALFSMRDVNARRLAGDNISEKQIQELVQREIALGKNVSAVLSASQLEKEMWTQYGSTPVTVLGHCINITPTPRLFHQRSGFLFVGAIHDDNSPNADAVRWFVQEIFPLIRGKIGNDASLIIAGVNHSESIEALAKNGIQVTGYVDDLTELYGRARVFVAPTRYSAGIPLKILNAASHGLPVVATTILGTQLGWKNKEEFLGADTPEDFAEECIKLYTNSDLWMQIRENALNRVLTDCSQESFDEILKNIFLALIFILLAFCKLPFFLSTYG